MTALKEFQRLEATGLWRASSEEQRRDVVVSLGEATLVLSDMNDRALTHWSLAAIERANPGQHPARYHPDGDPGEELELDESASDMIEAIERLRREIERRRPQQGRLRWLLGAGVLSVFLVGSVFWLPDALLTHTIRVVPSVKRDAIGLALLDEVADISGPACAAETATPALRMLGRRVLGADRAGDLIVMRSANINTAHLPGGFILINKSIIEDYEDPDTAAGFILAETIRAADNDPLKNLLSEAGTLATARLLTTGQLPMDTLEAYAASLMSSAPTKVDDTRLLAAFKTAGIRSTPYAFARDKTGETTLALIEADPMSGKETEPVIADNDWLRLQTICGD